MAEATPCCPAPVSAMARALAVLGDIDGALAERNIAYALAVALEDDDDRAVIEGDLGTLPLPGAGA